MCIGSRSNTGHDQANVCLFLLAQFLTIQDMYPICSRVRINKTQQEWYKIKFEKTVGVLPKPNCNIDNNDDIHMQKIISKINKQACATGFNQTIKPTFKQTIKQVLFLLKANTAVVVQLFHKLIRCVYL